MENGRFPPPCPLHTDDGRIRRVGVELEFGGMSREAATEAVIEAFGGEARRDHEHRFTVFTDLGDFDVTYDTALLYEPEGARLLDRIGLGEGIKNAAEWLLKQFGGGVLPLEIGTPPLPVDRLADLDQLENALRDRKAMGTRRPRLPDAVCRRARPSEAASRGRCQAAASCSPAPNG
jgi:hypothetical protein